MASILLIDDNEEFRKLMQIGLSRLGHEVVLASDGDEGLRIFSEQAFDLVITDIIMPGKEGLETIIELKRLRVQIPIIAISGGGLAGTRTFLRAAIELGAAAALQKPVTLAALQEVILAHTQEGVEPRARRKSDENGVH